MSNPLSRRQILKNGLAAALGAAIGGAGGYQFGHLDSLPDANGKIPNETQAEQKLRHLNEKYPSLHLVVTPETITQEAQNIGGNKEFAGAIGGAAVGTFLLGGLLNGFRTSGRPIPPEFAQNDIPDEPFPPGRH